jgi:APA family basic amino acid/polyamine antiporter
MPPPYPQAPPSEEGGYRSWIVSNVPTRQAVEAGAPKLAAKLGLFDATMIVMGGVIGSGIFVNPAVVARHVGSPVLILGAWLVGGVLALIGAMIYAELGALLPKAGGSYAYLHDGFHPLLGFLYGWFSLLVINAGGTAAVSLVFAKYFSVLFPVPISERALAAGTILVLAAINCLGVRFGSNVQSALMILRAGGILVLIAVGIGWYFRNSAATALVWRPVLDRPVLGCRSSADLGVAFGSAMIPVFFAYGGWQTANFLAAEMREPRKNLPRALVMGVLGVVALYVGVTFACLAVLGPAGLAATSTPASDLMQRVLGSKGAAFMAVGIAISTLGFLSQSVLTYPRVFFAMAADGVFPAGVARVNVRTQVPVVAILLASLLTTAVVLAGNYDAILVYVESMDGLFFGLSALALFVFRRRAKAEGTEALFRAPGHPWTTLIFVTAYWVVVANSFYKYRANAALVLGILLTGVPLYFYWSRSKSRRDCSLRSE